MRFGSPERRASFLELAAWWTTAFTGYPGIPVNRKYQYQLTDPDLQHLLKSGKLERVRHAPARKVVIKTPKQQKYLRCWHSAGKNQTYLCLPKS